MGHWGVHCKLSDFVWGSYVWLWDPRVFLIPIPFPFYQELKLASHKLAVQNSLYYVVLFSIHHLWWWWWWACLPTRNGVFWSLEQLDYIEDWMEPRHGGWESEVVHILADSSCHCEGSEIAMGMFLQGVCGTDITSIQVYPLSYVILQSQNSALVVVPGHVFFGLCKHGPGLQECGIHPVSELVDSLELGFYLV